MEQNYYDARNEKASSKQLNGSLISDYLDGKPALIGKKKISRRQRDEWFWTSDFVFRLDHETYASNEFALALSRYFGQESTSNKQLLLNLAKTAPDTIITAVRYSGIVAQKNNKKLEELKGIAEISDEISELCKVIEILREAHQTRIEALEQAKKKLAHLTVIDFLCYAALYAFKKIIPVWSNQQQIIDNETGQPIEPLSFAQETEIALGDLLTWKVHTCNPQHLKVTEMELVKSVGGHISPFLFNDGSMGQPDWQALHDFELLVGHQYELNDFVSRSLNVFSYDDSVCYVRNGHILEIKVLDEQQKQAWRRNGRKMELLAGYWYIKGQQQLILSGLSDIVIGQPENSEANKLAYAKALSGTLFLENIYGVGEFISLEGVDKEVDTFQLLLALELNSVFFNTCYFYPYFEYLQNSGSWQNALRDLALGGLLEGENRFPITWAYKKDKIARTKGWTVSEKYPSGSAKTAEQIIDFCSMDMTALRKKLEAEPNVPTPNLSEKPYLKFGNILFQLPWISGASNNRTLVVNNLRRLGARRKGAQEEAFRLETILAGHFKKKGFSVVSNWHPPTSEHANPGEIDLICARDNIVFIFEIKSGYIRSTQQQVWLHKTNTLRRAGKQLQVKRQAVLKHLAKKEELFEKLGLDENFCESQVHGWILDTSIEHDHELVNGFLKVSIEEIYIALYDQADFLVGLNESELSHWMKNNMLKDTTLYPDGFSAQEFYLAITQERVWDNKI